MTTITYESMDEDSSAVGDERTEAATAFAGGDDYAEDLDGFGDFILSVFADIIGPNTLKSIIETVDDICGEW